MNQSLSLMLLLCVSSAFFVGCEKPPGVLDDKANIPLTSDWKRPEFIRANDAAEIAAVTKMERDRANYKYRLEVLAGYYHKVGNLDKYNWADSEYKNIDEAKTFKWENVPEITAPTGESLDNADERLLVEYAVMARNEYIADTAAVLKLLKDNKDSYKASVIQTMIDRLDPIRMYPYFPEAMLPSRDLKADKEIPAANALFEQALNLFKEGKGWAHWAISTSYPKEREACVKFMQLVRDYPQSTKIALSAYYIAEINKEYFNEKTLAVYWYERAWTWDPHLTEPARFQAATVYDANLHNYTKAVECYRLSMKYDPSRWGNYDYAEKRIKELTGQ